MCVVNPQVGACMLKLKLSMCGCGILVFFPLLGEHVKSQENPGNS